MTRTQKVWRALGAAALGIAVIGAAGSVIGNEQSKRPFHLRLTGEACSQMNAAAASYAKAHPGTAPTFPCSFEAYLLRTDSAGAFVTYGVSQNVAGQCGLVTTETLDKHRLEVDWEAPALRDTPAACHQFAGLHPRPGLWW